MSYYSILAVTPTDDAWIPGYVAAVGKLVTGHGGAFLARTASHERLEGEGEAVGMYVIIEWPSEDAAKAFMSDTDYTAYLAARTAGSVSHHVLIAGKDDMI